jgi:hypothetical protein
MYINNLASIIAVDAFFMYNLFILFNYGDCNESRSDKLSKMQELCSYMG